jgi:hypothetical protein
VQEPDEKEHVDARAEAQTLMETLMARCASAGIPCEIMQDVDGESRGRLDFPAGRGSRRVVVGEREIQSFLSIEFERLRLLERYEAVYSLEDDVIEASFASVRPGGNIRGLPAILQGPNRRDEGDPVDPIILHEPNVGDVPGMTIEIGPPSIRTTLFRPMMRNRRSTLTIHRGRLKTHDHATRLLESVANSLFLQIDSKWDTAFQLIRARGISTRRPRSTTDGQADLQFPASYYDPEPMSLYWYGRGAVGMPLLQFLAFYQVVEFYFPQFAQQELRVRLQNIVRSPQFSPHSDREIGRLVDALQSAGGRTVWGDEKGQLMATARACVDGQSIRELVEAYDDHFAKKIKGLADTTLRVAASDDDLVGRAVERIYEIRCKIVHTKDGGGGSGDLLLPFSPEAERLWPDIDLVELLSRGVLTAAARAAVV